MPPEILGKWNRKSGSPERACHSTPLQNSNTLFLVKEGEPSAIAPSESDRLRSLIETVRRAAMELDPEESAAKIAKLSPEELDAIIDADPPFGGQFVR